MKKIIIIALVFSFSLLNVQANNLSIHDSITKNKQILIFNNPSEFEKKFQYLYQNYSTIQKSYTKNSKNIIKQYDAKKKIRYFFRKLQS